VEVELRLPQQRSPPPGRVCTEDEKQRLRRPVEERLAEDLHQAADQQWHECHPRGAEGTAERTGQKVVQQGQPALRVHLHSPHQEGGEAGEWGQRRAVGGEQGEGEPGVGGQAAVAQRRRQGERQ